MKLLFNLLLLTALGLLLYDDNGKRGELEQALSRANTAEQQAQQLTAQVGRLQQQLTQVQSASSPYAAAQRAPVQSPSWFQGRLNGEPTVLDPGGTPQDPGAHR